MTENIIHSLLTSIGISISEGQISNIIIKEKADIFTKEKEEIMTAGIEASKNINIDDAGFKENGVSKYINIICNTLFSVFIVNDRKNQETVKKMFENYDLKDKVLGCDDAGQWKVLNVLIQLCWVHEERHFKKLVPVMTLHKEELKLVTSELWDFYLLLKEYKKNPNENAKNALSKMFDDIFDRQFNYPALNNRLALTYAKKDELLTVLENPDTDLHNNISENGIRSAVVKRGISNGTRVNDGTVAWSNHLSLLSTCKKLGVSYYDYVLDIFMCRTPEKKLATLIKEKATEIAA